VVVALLTKPEQVALVAQAVVARLEKRRELQPQEPLTPEAEAVVDTKTQIQMVRPAALASSSSSTTLALPQSSPSSHRRSGLHQRVR
jgi:hypothetical protein